MNTSPILSIVLPTYNRVSFLPQAFEAICSQTFADWELIVVDDGSTDDTETVVRQLAKRIDRPVRYVRQENRGAYGARNTGLDLASGKFVAFYDSDDRWLPHHLKECVDALEAHPEVDWVFTACRRVEHETGRILCENTFYDADGNPWPFLKLTAVADGKLRVLNDRRALECMLGAGLNCGLQTSVIRRQVFENYRFQTRFRNEAEDQLMVIYALAKGCRLAYYDAVHVVYNVHAANSSATASQGVAKRIAVIAAEARGYEELDQRGIKLIASERRVVRRRLLELYSWQIGYGLQWNNGMRADALAMFRRGLSHWPWSVRACKTFAILLVRHAVGLSRGTHSGSMTDGS
jgi:glycosyltransferase involved in cell wall biosynthesis